MNLTKIKDSDVHNITSVECFNQLSEISNSYLIDVMTKPEWEFICIPNLSSINKKTILISWHVYPQMKINSFFENQIIELSIKKNDKLFCICRSGGRSFHAANFLIHTGFNYCYNVSDGFEGDKNKLNQR